MDKLIQRHYTAEMFTDCAILSIARACHEVNKTYCEATGDDSQVHWQDAPQWQQDSAVAGVTMHLNNHEASPSDSHNSWLAQKASEGWKYGEVKDPEKKEHPCFVPYESLPQSQQVKDYLFIETVHSMAEFYFAICEQDI